MSQLSLSLARHSVFWLCLANFVGMLLSVLLLWPELNTALAPFSYGRWMPLHLDFQLYGWCSLPVVGLIFRWYFGAQSESTLLNKFAVWLWSLCLFLGSLSWLEGDISGKIFLDWGGRFRWLFPITLAALWLIIVGQYFFGRFRAKEKEHHRLRWLKCGFLLLLGIVPAVFFLVLNPGSYPPINPHSGGPTGVSLLGSVLGILLVFFFAPLFLELEERRPVLTRRIFGVLCLHFLIFLLLPHGHGSNRDLVQIFALLSVLLWTLCLPVYYLNFSWSQSCSPWLRSFIVWWVLLSLTGAIIFLPQFLDYAKYSNILVAHAHLAMAGMLTSFNFLILGMLLSKDIRDSLLGAVKSMWLWHVGLAFMLIALIALGLSEYSYGAAVYVPSRELFYFVRAGGGVMMTVASLSWFRILWKSKI